VNPLSELQGGYGEAEPLYKEALHLSEKVLGKEHPQTLMSLNNLAGLYYSQGRYGEAEPLYKEALHLREKVLGKEHPQTLTFLNNLAELYRSQGRYGEAEPLLKEALHLCEKVLGKEHPQTLMSLNNLAALYQSQGRYGEAEPLLKEALHLKEKVLGKEHPQTLTTQSNYIYLLINMKQTRTAFRLLKNRENLLFSRSFQELYSTSTERVRRFYLQNISTFQDLTLSFALAYPEPKHQVYAANVLLRWKQVYAEESAFQHRLMNLSNDPEVMKLKERISRLRADLSRKIRNPQFQKDVAEIWHNLTLTENEIRERAKKFKPELEVSGARLDQIAGLLPKDSVLIEFRLFYPRDLKTGKAENPHFAASVVLSDIEAEQQIAFEDVGAVEGFVKALEDSEKKPEKLYEYLLGRFDSRIKNLKKLYIAPDGNLSLISFASLRLSEGTYLTQRQQVAMVQTGRDLKVSPEKPLSNLLIAFGGVDYGEYAPDKTTKKEDTEELKHTNLRAARELDGMKYLKNSLYEAEQVKEIFITHSKDGKALVYKKGEATEKMLKNLEQPPRILHLSG
jgi:hypothetical protein